MKNLLRQYYHNFSNLSVDVIIGIGCNMHPLPIIFGFKPPVGWYSALLLGAWCIYLLDHLTDLKVNPDMNSPRHNFMRKYENNLKLFIAALVLIVLTQFALSPSLILLIAGTLTVGMAVLYFLFLIKPIQLKHLSLKEPAVALIYALGIYSVPLVIGHFNLPIVVYFLLFAGLAFQNLMMNSILEVRADLMNKQPTVVIKSGFRQSVQLFILLTMLLLILQALLVILNIYRELAIVYGCMTLMTAGLFQVAISFPFGKNVRVAAEIVFWLPLILYFIRIK